MISEGEEPMDDVDTGSRHGCPSPATDGLDAAEWAAALAPDDAWGHWRLGRLLERRGRLPEALAAFRRTLELEPGRAWLWSHLGGLLTEAGELDKAAAALGRALALAADDALSRYRLGRLLERRGRPVEALAEFRRAAELDPGQAWLWSHLGWVLTEAGELDEAEAALDRAVALAPEVALTHSRLARLLSRRARPEAALAAARRAAELDLANETTPAPPEEGPVDHEGIAERRRWLLSFARKGGIGAEFGVFRGHFAAVIARELAPTRLFLVDPWTKEGELFDWGPDPYTNFNTLTTAQAFLDTRHRMEEHASLCDIVYVEDYCENFCRNFDRFSERKLDFVYLDTSHNYHDTLVQLDLLDSIIQPDGVIMGDDWAPDVTHPHHGVMRAVHEFVKRADYQIVIAGPHAQFCLRRTPAYR
jgi:tetratricopeptide (TPR) repeat protein